MDNPNEMIRMYRENMRVQKSHSPLSLFYKFFRYSIYDYSFFPVGMTLSTKDATIGSKARAKLML